MTIHTYPSHRLGRYIEAYRIYHFDEGVDVHLLPKGVFEIVFQSKESFQHNTYYSTGWEPRPRNFIGGLHNKAYHVKSDSRQGYCIAVEFKPNTAKYFIPEKLDYFQHTVVHINDIWGKAAEILSRKLDKEKSDLLKIKLIEDFLVKRFEKSTPSKVDQAMQLIVQSRGIVQVSQLANQALLSASQFRKRFKEEVGISPSQYTKIVRINTSLALLPDHSQTLTDISYALGYFDQSHFIKDFKSVLGQSPKYYRTIANR